jgi:RNA polymerase sigma-70 factor (ECF subfamily)
VEPPRADLAAALGAAPSDELLRALAALVEAARAALPGVDVPPADFARHVAARCAGADPRKAIEGLHAADLYLACACARGDARAIALLEERFLAEVPRFLAPMRLPVSAVDEVRQLVRERLLVGDPPRIADYAGRGPLAGWLRVVALRLASDLRREGAGTKERADEPAIPAVDPELLLVKRRYGEAFNQAFADAFAALDPEERNLFRLFYLDGLNLDRIAIVCQVSRATAGRRMLAARKRLLDGTLRLVGERLRVPPDELESLLGVVRSRLEISLPGLLAERDCA